MRPFTKTPGESLDYALLWADWLYTDTIAAAAWDVPAGLTGSAETNTTTTTTITLSGGTAGADYVVTCQITTSAGRIAERSITVAVRATRAA